MAIALPSSRYQQYTNVSDSLSCFELQTHGIQARVSGESGHLQQEFPEGLLKSNELNFGHRGIFKYNKNLAIVSPSRNIHLQQEFQGGLLKHSKELAIV